MQHEPTLHAPDRQRLWNSLSLTMAQAAALTGASERQIQHWMDRGYVQPVRKGTRRINGEGLEMILLIRQARSGGVPLRHAVAASREYLARESSSAWQTAMKPAVIVALREQISSTMSELSVLHDILEGSGNRQ